MSLHYGDPQIAIAVVFGALALLLATAFVVIGVQAGSEVGVERVRDVGYWLRKRWLALLLVVGVVVVGISLFDLPYASGGGTVVKVTGGQRGVRREPLPASIVPGALGPPWGAPLLVAVYAIIAVVLPNRVAATAA